MHWSIKGSHWVLSDNLMVKIGLTSPKLVEVIIGNQEFYVFSACKQTDFIC